VQSPKLHALEPHGVGWMFRPAKRVGEAGDGAADGGPISRWGWAWWAGATIDPRTRFMIVALLVVFPILIMSENQGVLMGAPGARAVLGLFVWKPDHPGRVTLALLQDPAALVIIGVSLSTPIFVCHQVSAIAEFVGMNERNRLPDRLAGDLIPKVNQCVEVANRRFARIGKRPVSAAILLGAGLGSAFLYRFLSRRGLMENWNPTSLSGPEWRRRVYDGWWANFGQHPALAVCLWALGTYTFYYLAKQLALGVIFAQFGRSAADIGFKVIPQFKYNSDGFHGLRPLRQFIQWTASSSLVHLAGLLCLFVVWLPLAQWTLFVFLGVMVVDILANLYPASEAYQHMLPEKEKAAAELAGPDVPDAERRELIEKLWEGPVLPFRTRATLTTITVYLLAPLLVAWVSVLFNR
jgi:hypothetical protein